MYIYIYTIAHTCARTHIYTHKGFPGGSDKRESAWNAGDSGSIPGSGNPLQKGMATHSSILAWDIPWTEESGWLQSMEWQRSDTTEQLSLQNHTKLHRYYYSGWGKGRPWVLKMNQVQVNYCKKNPKESNLGNAISADLLIDSLVACLVAF